MALIEAGTVTFVHAQSLKAPGRGLMQWIGFVDAWLNRPIASLVARAAFPTRLSPNDLSYLSCLLGLAGAWCLSYGSYREVVAGALLAQAAGIVDGADGMLARARQACSSYGAHLDLLLDRIIDFFVLAGIALGLAARSGNATMVTLGLLTAGLYLLQIHLFYLTKSALGVKATGETGEARAVLYWAVLGFAVADRLDLFVYVMLAETVIVNFARLIYFMRLGSRLNSTAS